MNLNVHHTRSFAFFVFWDLWQNRPMCKGQIHCTMALLCSGQTGDVLICNKPTAAAKSPVSKSTYRMIRFDCISLGQDNFKILCQSQVDVGAFNFGPVDVRNLSVHHRLLKEEGASLQPGLAFGLLSALWITWLLYRILRISWPGIAFRMVRFLRKIRRPRSQGLATVLHCEWKRTETYWNLSTGSRVCPNAKVWLCCQPDKYLDS